MPLNTLTAASNITPVVLKTFVRHFKAKFNREKQSNHNDPSNDILFDQAFHIVKKFMDLCTYSEVESIQAFSNTHIPSPPWSTVISVMIPLSKCNEAADILIQWFGPESILSVVGGERWWQVRGLDGIEAEWVTMNSFIGVSVRQGMRQTPRPAREKMNQLQRVMLYIHGGAFYWGSINTHRYQILRLARKIEGRCFAVNYRKAPQYPWPCPLQDVLAAYLYLIHPPPSAEHSAIDPKHIVIAGDSAGGGLALSLLTILRDLNLPMPAGTVLISPWVDLTHSFPSVMQNTRRDIIPKYGFIHKPSTLWPVTVQEPHDVSANLSDTKQAKGTCSQRETTVTRSDTEQLAEKPSGHLCGSEMASNDPLREATIAESTAVSMSSPNAEPIWLESQIQLYATNDQLTHPLVSPLLQGSLGGFCPLYILAGDEEVLRDEIVYLAHRAAHPSEYPLREDLLRKSERQRHNVDQFQSPTKVHLQIVDGMPHVMTVYSFYSPVKYAYRAIAAFARHVIDHPSSSVNENPFPELHLSDDGPVDNSDDSDLDSRVGGSGEGGSHVQGSLTMPSKHNDLEHPEDSKKTKSHDDTQPTLSDEVQSKFIVAERVDLQGRTRPLESLTSLSAFGLPTAQIGIIKDEPAKRYLEGQKKWDEKYLQKAESVAKARRKWQSKAEQLLENAKEQGLMNNPERSVDRTALDVRRWGPLDLEDEHPPPSAIAGRRDTPEAIALLRSSFKAAKPGTKTSPTPKTTKPGMFHKMRAKVGEVDPSAPVQHSASEQQVYREFPMHGLNIWAGIIRIFMKESRKNARKQRRSQAETSITQEEIQQHLGADSH